MSDLEPIGAIIERIRPTWEQAREVRTSWECRQIHYKTVLLPFEQAERFARCIQANPDRFEQVDLFFYERARDGRDFYVQFASQPDGIGEPDERRAATAERRAGEEGSLYVYTLDLTGPRPFYQCLSLAGAVHEVVWRLGLTGEVHQVDACGCTCPEAQRRAARTAPPYRCVHWIEMLQRVEEGRLLALRDVTSTPAWQQKYTLRSPSLAHSLTEPAEIEPDAYEYERMVAR